MPADTLLSAIRAHLALSPTHRVVMEPIQKGASGRTIIRIKPDNHPSFIGIHYTLERSDNANFLPVSEFLTSAGLNIPNVLYDNIRRHVALIEDLGDNDLLSLKDAPFEEREPYYRSAFEQLDKLLYTRPPKDFDLQPLFDEPLYRWEQEYFFEHFVETHLGKDSSELREDPISSASPNVSAPPPPTWCTATSNRKTSCFTATRSTSSTSKASVWAARNMTSPPSSTTPT
jgi:aminoglycoside/choline kinase family phosphotransferase